MSLDEQFQAAVAKMNAFKGPIGNQDMLRLYGLYKQATAGDVQGKRPGALDLKGRAKYDAWAGCRGMSAEDAKRAYVELTERW